MEDLELLCNSTDFYLLCSCVNYYVDTNDDKKNPAGSYLMHIYII